MRSTLEVPTKDLIWLRVISFTSVSWIGPKLRSALLRRTQFRPPGTDHAFAKYIRRFLTRRVSHGQAVPTSAQFAAEAHRATPTSPGREKWRRAELVQRIRADGALHAGGIHALRVVPTLARRSVRAEARCDRSRQLRSRTRRSARRAQESPGGRGERRLAYDQGRSRARRNARGRALSDLRDQPRRVRAHGAPAERGRQRQSASDVQRRRRRSNAAEARPLKAASAEALSPLSTTPAAAGFPATL